jgi:UTP--glucose-1-phosphate uridylyltransferase
MSDLWPTDERLCATLDETPPGAAALARLRADWLAGRLGEAHNRVTGHVVPPMPEDLDDAADVARRPAAVEAGRDALRRSAAGLVILNGGMATRFGGVVKGVVPVDGDRSFLAFKLLDALRAAEACGAPPPVVMLMNSRATSEATRAHLEAHDFFGYPRARVWAFEQQWTARLDADGGIFVEDDGHPSFYGPGHGDLGPCLQASGLLERFVAGGGRTLLMSNVDNVVATLDPGLLGHHRRSGARITVELVDKWAGDAGGAPARVDGRLQIVEGFRFPVGFDQTIIPVFNTNTLWFDTAALAVEHPLTWFVVHKQVDGRPVVQFERLVGELTAFEATRWVRVARDGLHTRFVPIKSPADLETTRPALLAAWHARGLSPESVARDAAPA